MVPLLTVFVVLGWVVSTAVFVSRR